MKKMKLPFLDVTYKGKDKGNNSDEFVYAFDFFSQPAEITIINDNKFELKITGCQENINFQEAIRRITE